MFSRRRSLSLLVCALAVSDAAAADPETQPGTTSLTMMGDLSKQMHEAADREMDRRMAAAQAQRGAHWQRDASSPVAYEKSVAQNREHLKLILGLLDQRVPTRLERFGSDEEPQLIAETERMRVVRVRWPVLEGVSAEGLFLEPVSEPRGYVIALPDAWQTPEDLAGLG